MRCENKFAASCGSPSAGCGSNGNDSLSHHCMWLKSYQLQALRGLLFCGQIPRAPKQYPMVRTRALLACFGDGVLALAKCLLLFKVQHGKEPGTCLRKHPQSQRWNDAISSNVHLNRLCWRCRSLAFTSFPSRSYLPSPQVFPQVHTNIDLQSAVLQDAALPMRFWSKCWVESRNYDLKIRWRNKWPSFTSPWQVWLVKRA